MVEAVRQSLGPVKCQSVTVSGAGVHTIIDAPATGQRIWIVKLTVAAHAAAVVALYAEYARIELVELAATATYSVGPFPLPLNARLQAAQVGSGEVTISPCWQEG